MDFKVFIRDKGEVNYTCVGRYDTELSASERARDLYQRGAYSVKVVAPNNTESTLWCKPPEQWRGVK